MNRPRRGLCTRCGAVLDDVVVDDEGRGACPSCGLGWTESALVFSERAAQPSPELERRRQQTMQRLDERRRDAVANRRFPVYGLGDAWAGRRWLGGWGGHDGGVDRLELAHGDAWHDDAPLLRITAWAPAHRARQRGFSAEAELAARRRNAAQTPA